MVMCRRYQENSKKYFFSLLFLFVTGFLISSSYAKEESSLNYEASYYSVGKEGAVQGPKPSIHLLNKRESETILTQIPPKLYKTTLPPKKATFKLDPTKPTITKNTTPETRNGSREATTPMYSPGEEYTEPPNITKTEDTHTYYNSSFITDSQEAMMYWVDFDNLPTNHSTVHEMLSSSHRRADTIPLKFDFPFYGHKLPNITIATGGFLYTGEHMHSWLAATQYIAPLMANFDTSLKNTSHILYYDNGTAFTVYWKNAPLQDRPNDGDFSFQVTLFENGNIVFVYKEIPLNILDINDQVHPVKIGLSDAYVVDKLVFYFQKKTIYEYHRVDLKKLEVSNHTAIYFTALPTCNSFTICEACMSSQISFDCQWCERAKRCSSGIDRHRQEWFIHQCDQLGANITCPAANASAVATLSNTTTAAAQSPVVSVAPSTNASTTNLPSSESSTLSAVNSTLSPPPSLPSNTLSSTPGILPSSAVEPPNKSLSPAARVQPDPLVVDRDIHMSKAESESKSSSSVGTVVAVLTIIALIGGVALWTFYAYKNPQSPSGQLLIKYRPSQWRWKHGEARYTAASSIHI